MSLLSMNLQKCTHMMSVQVPDGEGGSHTTWKEGGVFYAALVLASSTKTDTAEKDVAADSYTVTTRKSDALRFGDVFRSADGTTYKVVSDVKRTPVSAGLDMAQITAERWDLPT